MVRRQAREEWWTRGGLRCNLRSCKRDQKLYLVLGKHLRSQLHLGVMATSEASDFDVCGRYPEDMKTSEDVLQLGKDFIWVVQTCVLIVQTLPALVSAARPKAIEAHSQKMKSLGINLPPNLNTYLNNESKKTKR